MSLFSVTNEMKEEMEKNYQKAIKNPAILQLIQKLKLSPLEAKACVTKLEQTIMELKNSQTDHELSECPNQNAGYILIPEKKEGILYFSYANCSCRKKELKEQKQKDLLTKELEYVMMSDIDKSDKNRSGVIKWILDFYKNYDYNKTTKGLYLSGNFGSGKTFFIHALFNELKSKKNIQSEAVYFPDLLRQLKDNWEVYADKMKRLQNVALLLIDDIGAEKVSEWGRDEVLGTILQTRMNQKLPTFFTSNLTIEELEKHLAISKNNIDLIKARRIIERITFLAETKQMISENRR